MIFDYLFRLPVIAINILFQSWKKMHFGSELKADLHVRNDKITNIKVRINGFRLANEMNESWDPSRMDLGWDFGPSPPGLKARTLQGSLFCQNFLFSRQFGSDLETKHKRVKNIFSNDIFKNRFAVIRFPICNFLPNCIQKHQSKAV